MNIGYRFTDTAPKDGAPLPAICEDSPDRPGHYGWPWASYSRFWLDPFSALEYATGPMLHIVHDTGAGTERTLVASIDATDMLRKFACDEALRVLPDDAPNIVRRYLTTRDEKLRDRAWSAAWSAVSKTTLTTAVEAARTAALSAAWCATRDEPWVAAWGSAWSVALGAAQTGSWAEAWDAERNAQRARFNAAVPQVEHGGFFGYWWTT